MVRIVSRRDSEIKPTTLGRIRSGYEPIAGSQPASPTVEQVRLEAGKIVVEMSEVIASEGFDSSLLQNLTKGTTVPVEWDRPIVEGRRALHRVVIEPQSPDSQNPTIEAGDQLRWTLPASALVDSFGNRASSDYVASFAWSATASQVIDDTTPPELLEACVVGKKVRLGFSEPLDASTYSQLQVPGVTAWQPTADGYGVESTTPLAEGTATLTIGAVTDLDGQSLAASTPASLSIDVQPTPTSAYQAPFAGESTTSAVGNTLGFQGLPLDEETGFYYVRNRYYDPTMGGSRNRTRWDMSMGRRCMRLLGTTR